MQICVGYLKLVFTKTAYKYKLVVGLWELMQSHSNPKLSLPVYISYNVQAFCQIHLLVTC